MNNFINHIRLPQTFSTVRSEILTLGILGWEVFKAEIHDAVQILQVFKSQH